MYEKQNFVSGQVLKAEHMNHIEEGIVKSERPKFLFITLNSDGEVSTEIPPEDIIEAYTEGKIFIINNDRYPRQAQVIGFGVSAGGCHMVCGEQMRVPVPHMNLQVFNDCFSNYLDKGMATGGLTYANGSFYSGF